MGGSVDHARAGASYRWTWQLSWYDDLPGFHADRQPLIGADRLAAEVGETIQLTGSGPSEVTSDEPGVVHVEATDGQRTARIAVLFHQPLRDIAEQQCGSSSTSSDGRSWRTAASTLSCRTTTKRSHGAVRRVRDWSDARERIGMALLLQEVRDRGWGDRAELDEALAGYEEFVREHVVDDDGTVQDDSIHQGRVGSTTSRGSRASCSARVMRPARLASSSGTTNSAGRTSSPSTSDPC